MVYLFKAMSDHFTSNTTEISQAKPVCSTFKFSLDSYNVEVTQCIRFTAKEIKEDSFPFFDQKADEAWAKNHPMAGSR